MLKLSTKYNRKLKKRWRALRKTETERYINKNHQFYHVWSPLVQNHKKTTSLNISLKLIADSLYLDTLRKNEIKF